MESISVHDTGALAAYYRDHVYDPSIPFEWICLADRVMSRNTFLGILTALLALAICASHKKWWQAKHWLLYKKIAGAYVRRW